MKIPFLQIAKSINANFSIDKNGTGVPTTVPSLGDVGRALRNPPGARKDLMNSGQSVRSNALIGSTGTSGLFNNQTQNKTNSVFGSLTYDKVTISAQGKSLIAQDNSLASKLRKQVDDE